MVVTGEYNESFTISCENDEPTWETNIRLQNVKVDDYNDTNSINMITDSYEYYSKLKCIDIITKDRVADSSNSKNVTDNSSCCIDVCDINNTKNSTSTENNTVDIGYSNISFSNDCVVDFENETDSHCKKTRSPSCSSSVSCSNIDNSPSMGRIFYNCDTNNLCLKAAVTNTKLISAVPAKTCCDCESGSSPKYVNTPVTDTTSYKEVALVNPVNDNVERCRYDVKDIQITFQNSNSLSRSITEHSLKSCSDELPSYRSLIAFRLQDSPPNYESVTGIRVNVDEIRKDVTFTRNRLRREVRNCSDLNSSAKRLLVLMAAIIVAICIVMIILTI